MHEYILYSSSHQATSSDYHVKELLLTALGPQHSYPHLLAFIDNDLVIYKAYQYPLSSVQGHLQLRFSKVSQLTRAVVHDVYYRV